ncbi:hypothetical protein H920_15553 [Fukomys damarensis]|uniref:Uncharacterized protein n=1 Tax=Fukomys damarensis TaxID=885580 RepID=A0A091CXR5_FUKDA|nr:hypothetical protein H920_15553 [Fukomys damarensis]
MVSWNRGVVLGGGVMESEAGVMESESDVMESGNGVMESGSGVMESGSDVMESGGVSEDGKQDYLPYRLRRTPGTELLCSRSFKLLMVQQESKEDGEGEQGENIAPVHIASKDVMMRSSYLTWVALSLTMSIQFANIPSRQPALVSEESLPALEASTIHGKQNVFMLTLSSVQLLGKKSWCSRGAVSSYTPAPAGRKSASPSREGGGMVAREVTEAVPVLCTLQVDSGVPQSSFWCPGLDVLLPGVLRMPDWGTAAVAS